MSGYLKVMFEGVGTQKLIDLLTEEQWIVVGAVAGMLIVDAELSASEKLHDAVWEHNGGMWCVVAPISYDDADQYL